MFYVYLLASKPYGILYIGTTSDLARRVWEHKNKVVPGFTRRYGVDRLVWFEAHQSADAALQREKRLKEWKWNWNAGRDPFPPWAPASAGVERCGGAAR
jgi:putative endonuclease